MFYCREMTSEWRSSACEAVNTKAGVLPPPTSSGSTHHHQYCFHHVDLGFSKRVLVDVHLNIIMIMGEGRSGIFIS